MPGQVEERIEAGLVAPLQIFDRKQEGLAIGDLGEKQSKCLNKTIFLPFRLVRDIRFRST